MKGLERLADVSKPILDRATSGEPVAGAEGPPGGVGPNPSAEPYHCLVGPAGAFESMSQPFHDLGVGRRARGIRRNPTSVGRHACLSGAVSLAAEKAQSAEALRRSLRNGGAFDCFPVFFGPQQFHHRTGLAERKA